MGAKQSKRSVDISGKEAENAGEVAAAGAGGEGRLEQLADADALKPQLNGDAHIHEKQEEQKDLDSCTPENEKDATTEKEEKQDEEKPEQPLTNGESEQKVENGDSSPMPEDGKKPKKEKVKKKWSLRSISFSRKDKPKQEKKQKDEETKTNGEPEKLPEETAEVAPEVPVAEAAEEVTTPSETKEEKTPETPVTEPITNGSTTPESPVTDTPAPVDPPSTTDVSPQDKPEVKPEQLHLNGLSLEPAKEINEVEKIEESKEETPAATTEIVPEIPVKKEVCVEQLPLIESTPPPLPANPPPSSVASFAATTMAPESADASLANNAQNTASPPPSDTIATPRPETPPIEPESSVTDIQTTIAEIPSPVKEGCEESPDVIVRNEAEISSSPVKETIDEVSVPSPDDEIVDEVSVPVIESKIEQNKEHALDSIIPPAVDVISNIDIKSVDDIEQSITIEKESEEIAAENTEELPSPPSETAEEPEKADELPPPPSPAACGALPNGARTPPAPPAPPAAPTQEPILPISDKLAELIPEVPDVPELKTEMLQETTSDVAVAN